MHGKVLTVRHQAVNRRKDNRFAVALDSEQNNIHVKDIVKVIDGPHSVRPSLFTPLQGLWLKSRPRLGPDETRAKAWLKTGLYPRSEPGLN